MNDGEAAGEALEADWKRRRLLERPGFLARRLHQIHVALFMEECAGFDITPVQYSLLTELAQSGQCEQAALARTLCLDRTNTADVIGRLKRRGLVERNANPRDKRSRLVKLTPAGQAALDPIDAPAERAHARTMATLPPAEREAFLETLARLVRAGEAAAAQSPRLR